MRQEQQILGYKSSHDIKRCTTLNTDGTVDTKLPDIAGASDEILLAEFRRDGSSTPALIS